MATRAPIETAPIEVVGLDADDTLWHDEPKFMDISGRFYRLLEQYLSSQTQADKTQADQTQAGGAQTDDTLTGGPQATNMQATNTSLEATIQSQERANLELFGYGVKAYTLSLIETAISVTQGRISAYDIHQIVQWGKEMLSSPVELLDGVLEVVPQLAKQYSLIVITKGDLWNQEAKVARSGLDGYLEAVEVVAEKDVATYRRVLARHGVDINRFAMAGNSLRSDIAPVLELGGRAVHICYPNSWALDKLEGTLDPSDYSTITTIRDLPQAIANL